MLPRWLGAAHGIRSTDRREFIPLLGGAAATWSFAARASSRRACGYRFPASRSAARSVNSMHSCADLPIVATCRGEIVWSRNGATEMSRGSRNSPSRGGCGRRYHRGRGRHCRAGRRSRDHHGPIVMAGAVDPFAGGLVKSLSHPGGNVTGFSSLDIDLPARFEMSRRWSEMKRIAVLATRTIWRSLARQDQAAKVLRRRAKRYRYAATRGRGVAMHQAIAAGRRGLRPGCPLFSAVQRRISSIARPNFGSPSFTSGATMWRMAEVATADHIELYRAKAGYVGKILEGEKCGKLPVQRPNKFELLVNLKSRNGARPKHSGVASCSRRRGDRVKRREFITLLAAPRAHRSFGRTLRRAEQSRAPGRHPAGRF